MRSIISHYPRICETCPGGVLFPSSRQILGSNSTPGRGLRRHKTASSIPCHNYCLTRHMRTCRCVHRCRHRTDTRSNCNRQRRIFSCKCGSGIKATIRSVRIISHCRRNSRLGSVHQTHRFTNLRFRRVILISRKGDSSQNTNNRDNDHQFDQGKTLLATLFELLVFHNGTVSRVSDICSGSRDCGNLNPGAASMEPPLATTLMKLIPAGFYFQAVGRYLAAIVPPVVVCDVTKPLVASHVIITVLPVTSGLADAFIVAVTVQTPAATATATVEYFPVYGVAAAKPQLAAVASSLIAGAIVAFAPSSKPTGSLTCAFAV